MSIATVDWVSCGLRAEGLLYISQVETDQPIGKKHGRNPAGASQPVHGGFADLQDFGELTRGEIVRAFIF